MHKQLYQFDRDIKTLILKKNLHQKHERELWEDKFICLLGAKALWDSIQKHCKRKLYEAFIDLTA